MGAYVLQGSVGEGRPSMKPPYFDHLPVCFLGTSRWVHRIQPGVESLLYVFLGTSFILVPLEQTGAQRGADFGHRGRAVPAWTQAMANSQQLLSCPSLSICWTWKGNGF